MAVGATEVFSDLGLQLRTEKKQGVIVLTKAERRARILRAAEIFRRHGVRQEEVGGVVGASQPQVSRVLQGNLSRATKLSEEICLYAERLEDGGVTWDSSSARARALASVIRSLAVLNDRAVEGGGISAFVAVRVRLPSRHRLCGQ